MVSTTTTTPSPLLILTPPMGPIPTSVWLAYAGLVALRCVSFITTCTVIYNIVKGSEILNPIIRACMCTMYCSSFLSDISYCCALYIKSRRGEIFLTVVDMLYDSNIIHVIFFHELGFAIFGIGIFLTSTERLINSRSDFYLQHRWGAFVIALFMIPIILSCSALWAYGLTNVGYNVAAAIVGALFFILASIQLLLAVYFNIRNYKRGLGQSLDKRFKSASTYYFNRHLFISIFGEICMRSIAYSFIFSLAVGMSLSFEWCSFIYHNLLAVGNVIFPWLIILRGRKSTLIRQRTGVTDLRGNQLKLRVNIDDYENMLNRMWN